MERSLPLNLLKNIIVSILEKNNKKEGDNAVNKDKEISQFY